MIINNIALLGELFNYLNCKINYVWIHGYNNESLGDVDIAINECEFNKIEKYILEFCDKNGFKLLQILQHEYCAKYFVLGKQTENSTEYLIPDICSNYVRDSRILIKAIDLLGGRVYNGQFYHCNSLTEAKYILLKRTLKKEWGINHLKDFKNIYNNNTAVVNCLDIYLKDALLQELIINIEKDDINALNGIIKQVRKSVLLRTFIKNPLQYFHYQINNFLRIIKRVIKPTGLFIAIIGTDGSGKSTVINKLSAELAPVFRRISLQHWKPSLFNKNNSQKITVTEPHKEAPRSIFVSCVKLLIYLLQYLSGYVIKIFPMKVRSTLIVFDRYYYDFLVDQKRFRLKLPKKIIKIFSFLIPRPDLIFHLNTKPSIALERKNELNLEELKRQNEEFASLRNLLKERFFIIENNEDAVSAVNKITSVVFNYLEKRVIAG